MRTSTAQLHARPHSHHHSHHHACRSVAAAAPGASAAKPKLCNPRHPGRTLLYQTLAEHFQTWFELASAGQFDGQGDQHTPTKPYVRQAFRKFWNAASLPMALRAPGVMTAGTTASWPIPAKVGALCPSCSTRCMGETAAHLTDHVFPRLPVRQWVLSVPKRLRFLLQRDGAVLNMVLLLRRP